MPKANPKSTTEIATQVASGLFDFEDPLLRARDLIYVAKMAASSAEMTKEAHAAFEVLTITILDLMGELAEERTRLWVLANTCAEGAIHG